MLSRPYISALAVVAAGTAVTLASIILQILAGPSCRGFTVRERWTATGLTVGATVVVVGAATAIIVY